MDILEMIDDLETSVTFEDINLFDLNIKTICAGCGSGLVIKELSKKGLDFIDKIMINTIFPYPDSLLNMQNHADKSVILLEKENDGDDEEYANKINNLVLNKSKLIENQISRADVLFVAGDISDVVFQAVLPILLEIAKKYNIRIVLVVADKEESQKDCAEMREFLKGVSELCLYVNSDKDDEKLAKEMASCIENLAGMMKFPEYVVVPFETMKDMAGSASWIELITTPVLKSTSEAFSQILGNKENEDKISKAKDVLVIIEESCQKIYFDDFKDIKDLYVKKFGNIKNIKVAGWENRNCEPDAKINVIAFYE